MSKYNLTISNRIGWRLSITKKENSNCCGKTFLEAYKDDWSWDWRQHSRYYKVSLRIYLFKSNM
jgi:hypothetical protein